MSNSDPIIEADSNLDDSIINPTEPSVTVDELDSWVKSHLDTDPPGSGVEQEEERQVPAPVSSPPAPSDDDLVRLSDDLALSRSEAKTLYDLSQELQRNPELAAAITDYYSRRNTPPAPAVEPPPVDLQDPVTRYFYEQQQAALQEIRTVRQALDDRTGSIVEVLQQREVQEKSAIVSHAQAEFQTSRGLNDEEITLVHRKAAEMFILPGLVSSGLPLHAAVQQALDTAYWSLPQFREKAIQHQVTIANTDTTRKRKLAAVGGNSGSSPRHAPAPKTDMEMRKAMEDEVRTMLYGNE